MVEGRRLFIRRGENLAEPSGQLLIDFDAANPDDAGDVDVKRAGGDSVRGRRFARTLTIGAARRTSVRR